MNIECFGKDNKLATVTVSNKYVTGYIVHSKNNKYSLIYNQAHSSEGGELNLAFITGDSVVFKRIVRPMKAVISESGIIALINLHNTPTLNEDKQLIQTLEFYDINGKILKKLKSSGDKLFLTPDQKYLLVQNLHTDDNSTDRMLTIYDFEKQKKIDSIYNYVHSDNFEFSEDSKTLKLYYKDNAKRFGFKYAEINLDF